MLGILVILIISWGLLYFTEKKHIDVLGIIPSGFKIIQFLVGFLFISIIVSINIFIETKVLQIEWKANQINYNILWNAFVYHIRSALTEDLVFRGAILYILMKRIGLFKALLISAIIFGVYHWFSYGILNERWILLVYVFIITGFTGFVWAYAFHKTKSIMLGLGFHLGYNFIMSCFYESQPYGELLFTQISRVNIKGWSEFYFSVFKGLFPSFATLIFVKLMYSKNKLTSKGKL